MTPEEVIAQSGNSAWMLISASLVLLMTPALALFYGGMSRQKSVLNMMMMSFGALGVGIGHDRGQPTIGGDLQADIAGPARREQGAFGEVGGHR